MTCVCSFVVVYEGGGTKAKVSCIQGSPTCVVCSWVFSKGCPGVQDQCVSCFVSDKAFFVGRRHRRGCCSFM